MKKIIGVLVFMLLCLGVTCFSTKDEQEEHVHVEKYPSKDSILSLADEVIEYVLSKESSKQDHIDSLISSISNSKNLSQDQLRNIGIQLALQKRQCEECKAELEAYRTKRLVRKDSIVIDIVKRKKYITDTIRDTIVVPFTKMVEESSKNKKRNKNKNKNKKRNE